MLTLALGAFAPLLAFAVIMVVLFSREQQSLIDRGARDTARALSLAVDREIERSMTTLEALATSDDLRAGRLTQFHTDARRVLPSQDGWSDIMLFDVTGRRLLNVLPAAGQVDAEELDVVRRVAVSGRPSVSDLRIVEDGRKRLLTVHVPVIRDGRIVFVLAASFSPTAVARILEQQRLPEGWIGVVADRRNLIVARTLRGDDFVGRPVSRGLAQHAAASPEGSFRGDTVEGVDVHTSFSRAAVTGWMVAIGIPGDTHTRTVWGAVGGVVAVGLVLGLCAAAVALVLGRRVAGAMRALSDAARTLGAGGRPPAVQSAVTEVNDVARALEEAGALLRRRAEERDRVEADLQERDARLRLALAAGRMATWEWDFATDRIVWSDNVSPLTRGRLDGGASQAEAIGRMIHPEDRSRLREAVAVAMKPGESLDVEVRVAWPDGATGWAAISGRALHDAAGVPTRLVGVATDISARKRAEAEARQLAAIVQSSNDAIVGQRLDGTIMSWNAGAERVYGYTAAEARGRSMAMVYPPEAREEFEAILERVRHGEPVRQRAERVRKDGARIEVAISVSPVRDAEGRIVGVSTIARDVTEERRTERRLAALQTLADIALPLAPEPLLDELLRRVCTALACDVATVLLATDDGRELIVRACHGRPEDRGRRVPIGHGVCGRIAAERRPTIVHDLSAVDDDPVLRDSGLRSLLGVPLEAEERLIGVLYIASTVPRRYSEDDTRLLEVAGHRLAAAVDRAALFAAERAARAEAEDANRSKDQFLATLSHELRTPLQSMLAWLRMLRSGRLDERTAAQALATIERNTRAQSQLINDLLDISRIVAGKLHMDLRPVDAVEIIAAAVETVRASADAAGLTLIATLPRTAVTVSADPARLQQIALNLLSNAVKFTPAGGRVEVRLAREDGQAVLRVSDTGKGIEPDVLATVFERFRQGDAGTTRSHGGLGLGLAIVRHLVELHEGRVTAESAGADRGTTLTVRLPLVGGLESTARRAVRTRAAGSREAEMPSLNGVRVVLVEDEADARDVVCAVLERCGAEVTAVASAGEALDALRQRRADVLVSDISMPEQDGYDLIRSVRAMEDTAIAGIPAAALTALARAEDRAAALAAGYQIHVAKPVEPEELARVVLDLSRPTR